MALQPPPGSSDRTTTADEGRKVEVVLQVLHELSEGGQARIIRAAATELSVPTSRSRRNTDDTVR